MYINTATLDFIHEHRNDDVRTLALAAKRSEDIDIQFALQQIDGWQRARVKLPMWAGHEGIIYPPHISMEQCSSEQTACYKADAVLSDEMDVFVDLTGGFGVDFSYMSRRAQKAIYVEQQEHLCDIARHNFQALCMDNVEVVNGDGTEVLQSLPQKQSGKTTVIYLDPARRDVNGRKTYAVSDCTPDIVTLWPLLLKKADLIVIKLSPMLDHHEALRLLPGITEVHIVSAHNECKELLLVASPSRNEGAGTLFCVNDGRVFTTSICDDAHLEVCDGVAPGDVLLVPNASIMKGGCFEALCARYNVAAIDRNSHLFIAKNTDSIVDFPGRSFAVRAVCGMNKRELKSALAGITQANIAVRNFKVRAEELRKRLKLKDGGDTYIFGTTICQQQLLLICERF